MTPGNTPQLGIPRVQAVLWAGLSVVMASSGLLCGQGAAEPGEHVEQAGVEAVENVVCHAGEQLDPAYRLARPPPTLDRLPPARLRASAGRGPHHRWPAPAASRYASRGDRAC